MAAPSTTKYPRPIAPPAPAGPGKWVNTVPPAIQADPALLHGTFYSRANQTDIGYFVQRIAAETLADFRRLAKTPHPPANN